MPEALLLAIPAAVFALAVFFGLKALGDHTSDWDERDGEG